MIWPTVLADERAPLNCAAELLDGAVKRGWGGRAAVHYGPVTWTYAELLDKAERVASVLTGKLGLVPGNRVLLRGRNTPMLVAAWYGVLKAGGICVTTMPLLRSKELAHIVERAQITHALCEASCMEELDHAVEGSGPCRCVLDFTPAGDHPGQAVLDTAMAACRGGFSNHGTRAGDIALIAFTSGTTGRPKGAMHTHRDVTAAAQCFPAHVGLTRPGVSAGTPPLAFTFGLGALVLFPARFGGSARFPDGDGGMDDLLACIRDYQVDTLYTAPTMYRRLAASSDSAVLRRLRNCVSAGEVLPADTWHTFHEVTGIRIADCLGATEMMHGFVGAGADRMRPGRIGTPVGGYEVQIVNEDGVPCAPGESGLLRVRGPGGCRYLDDVDRQAEYVRDGWNYPGDVCRVEEDGYLSYVARADDMIISAGYNIAAPEVEEILRRAPEVADCAVVGAPDPERTSVVKAYVVLAPGVNPGPETVRKLQDFAKAQMAPYKYPRLIEFIDELPRTATGKLQRSRLRSKQTPPA